MWRAIKSLQRDQGGGVLVETTVMLVILFVFVLGSVDFLFAMYQWNAAGKAVQVGARIAAVSDPVATGLTAITGLEGGATPGDPAPSFATMTCNGASLGGGCSATAMNNLVYGRGRSACNTAGNSFYTIGMCNVFWRVTPANVMVTYEFSGLGFAGRPGGPVPTITVRLQNLTYQFVFLGGLMGFNNMTIPALTTTITGEDLSSSAPP